MIFENIQHISSKEEFLEKILIYIRLVEVTAERNNLTLPSDVEVSSNLVKELISIGIIVNKEDVAELQKLIKPLYQRFVCCVNFYLHNKKIFGKSKSIFLIRSYLIGLFIGMVFLMKFIKSCKLKNNSY